LFNGRMLWTASGGGVLAAVFLWSELPRSQPDWSRPRKV